MIPIRHIRRALLVSLGLLVPVIYFGCNGGIVQPPSDQEHQIRAVVVVDPNLGGTRIAAVFERNDTLVTTGDISLAGRSLVYDHIDFPVDSVYSYSIDSITALRDSVYKMFLTDPPEYYDSTNVTVPDTFQMRIALPVPPRIIYGNGNATLNWDGASLANAYVLAAVKEGREYTGQGYSAYSAEGATGGTIPPEAFLIEGEPNPDTGLYRLYVYAISGTPDSAMTNYLLPVPLPSQLSDNVDQTLLRGRVGSVVVARYDTVRVAYYP